MAGRRFGKTRASSEWLANEAIVNPGLYGVININAAETNKVNLFGREGVQKILERKGVQTKSDKRALTMELPNGSQIFGYVGSVPDNIRGKGFSAFLMDELAFYDYPEEIWNAANQALSAGRSKIVITTTPSKKSISLMKRIISDPTTHLTRGTSYENLSALSDRYFEYIKSLEGTRLHRIENCAELLEQSGVLFSEAMFKRPPFRVDPTLMDRIVVAIDPSISSNEDAGESGIIVAGKRENPDDPRLPNFYILEDYSKKCSPNEVIERAAHAYDKYKADYIVAEVNNGGEWISNGFKQVRPDIKVKTVIATRGKALRAEPIALLYEQGRVFHTEHFKALEDQMVDFDPEDPRTRKSKSPDRLDALVWGLSQLSGKIVGKLQSVNLPLW